MLDVRTQQCGINLQLCGCCAEIYVPSGARWRAGASPGTLILLGLVGLLLGGACFSEGDYSDGRAARRTGDDSSPAREDVAMPGPHGRIRPEPSGGEVQLREMRAGGVPLAAG